jgi:ubiquinone/menaquinone biosynthesis C-methylase UbiE
MRPPDTRYSPEPPDGRAFTARFDRAYTHFARVYDLAVKSVPLWRRWLRPALPHIRGPRVLEVSFGTGWLLTQYAGRFETHGVELNREMLDIARHNLHRAGFSAELQIADVEALPYPDDHFDTVVNTMSFTGYPHAAQAMAELRRVLKPGRHLVMVDINYPRNGNQVGTALVGLWRHAGDLIRDMDALFREFGFDVTDEEIGGFGSVHLYVATKR